MEQGLSAAAERGAEGGGMSNDPDCINFFTIYDSPSDFPGRFVVRRHELSRSFHGPRELLGEARNLADARKLVPSGAHNLGRECGDEPQIVETWIL